LSSWSKENDNGGKKKVMTRGRRSKIKRFVKRGDLIAFFKRRQFSPLTTKFRIHIKGYKSTFYTREPFRNTCISKSKSRSV
jgi:ASC-1-like (ASCH) protein